MKTVMKRDKVALDKQKQTFINKNIHTIVKLLQEEQATACTLAARTHSVDQIISSLQCYNGEGVHKSKDISPIITAQLAIEGLRCIIVHAKSHSAEDNGQFGECGNLIPHPLMLRDNEREHMENLVTIIQQLIKQNRFSTEIFTKLLMKFAQDDLCLEVLWFLDTRNIVSFTTYLLHFNNQAEVITELRDAFVQLLVSLEGDGQQQKVVVDLLTVLLQSRLQQSMLESLVHKITSLVMTSSALGSGCPAPSGIHFVLLKQHQWELSLPTNAALLDQLLLCAFHSILQHNCDTSDEEAIGQQAEWRQEGLPHNLTKFLENLLSAFGAKNAMEAMRIVVEGGNFSWKLLLATLTILLGLEPHAGSYLKGLIDRLLHQAFSACDSHLLATSFLLVRQACIQSSSSCVFQSYSDWFGSTFGSEARRHSLSNTSQQAFRFLLNFLTSIVPREQALYLRIHINKVPLAPPNCGGLLADYNQLAKTRLKDLGESSGVGLFGFELTAEEDILRALAHFEQTGGQVSQVVLNATVFRRQQYEEVFLARLLQPRCLPQPLDSRALFIEKMYQMGKISTALYSTYQANCMQAESGDSKGGLLNLQTARKHAFSLTTWTKCMTQLTTTVRACFEVQVVDREDKEVMLRAFENVKITAATVLKDLSTVTQIGDSEDLCTMVVAKFLRAFIQCFIPPGMGDDSTWPGAWLSLLHPFPNLCQQLSNVTEDLCQKHDDMACHQVNAAAVLVLTMHSQGQEFWFRAPSLAETVSHHLLLRDHCEMIHCFKFAVQYLKHAELQITFSGRKALANDDDMQVDIAAARLHLESLVPVQLLKKYLFLRDRLPHTIDSDVFSSLNSSWNPQMRAELWTTLIFKAKISLQYWLELEFEVQDGLSDTDWLQYAFLWLRKYCSQTQREMMNQLLKSSLDYAVSSEIGLSFSKRLLLLLSWEMEHDGHAFCLLQAWKDLSATYKHEDIFRAMKSLPRAQLFSGCSSSMEMSVAAVSEFISCYLKDSMAEKGVLPLSFVQYVLMGLASNFSARAAEPLSHLLESCLAFHVAILAHARYVHPIMVSYFSSGSSSAQDNIATRLQLLISLVLPHTDSTVVGDLQQRLPHCQDWEIGLLLWFAGDFSISGEGTSKCRNCSKKYLSMQAWLPPDVPYWSFLFSIVEFGNLLVEGKLTVQFVGNNFEFQPVKGASYECSILHLTSHLLSKPKMLVNLAETFNHKDQQAFGALSLSAQVMTAVGTVFLLMSVQPDDLRFLLADAAMAELYCHTLLTCHAKWKSVDTDARLWLQLNTAHQCKARGMDLNLLKTDFMMKMTKCVKLRSFNVAKK